MVVLWHQADEDRQDGSEMSHVGGHPKLPSDLALPVDPQTGDGMTFFFSIDLSFQPSWTGKVLSVFAVTSRFSEDDCIPELFTTASPGYDVPAGALTTYQRLFRIFVTDGRNGVLRDDYRPRVRYNTLRQGPDLPSGAVRFGERDILPRWILDEESPGSYGGKERFSFLFQTEQGYRYKTRPDAPRQIVPDYTAAASGGLTESLVDLYDLWVTNACYFFITLSDSVLVIPQSD